MAQIVSQAKTPEIGQVIDEAMGHIERENVQLKNVLYKVFTNPNLDKGRLGELIDIIGNIQLHSKDNKNEDVLGQVYEFFLGKFANSEGKNGGQFYTPESIVKTIVSCLEPTYGRVYDPCCGSGGMFVQSEKFVEAHQGNLGDISIFGQESNGTTWKLCKMNLAIRGIEVDLGKEPADTFTKNQHVTKKMDFIMANPPFNIKDYWHESLTGDARWQYGTPPEGNANYAWLQHMVHQLKPNGVAGIVLANGSLSSNTSSEVDIRKAMIEGDIVDCVIAMPDKLFLTTGIPACIWILNRGKGTNPKHRTREKETLFIDARNMGTMIDRKLRELKTEDIEKIAETYHSWRTEGGEYQDVKGFSKAAKLEDIIKHDYILTPGRYVGIPDEEDDGIPFEDKMAELTSKLSEQFSKSNQLEKEIRENLKSIGFELPNG
ncbi:N-6 DNA methylase [Thiospirochaeta perfilievii]|uniref:N-6 DNA methylase n=1 Tax=Thiospirochaeta perfilievii TaxID=252967 RepID=UPI001FEFFDE7|nr:N-6 DNA methylase [Thiospirochaeta perfilievii]